MDADDRNDLTPTEAKRALDDAQATSAASAARLPEHAHWYEVVWLAYIGGLVWSTVLEMPFNLIVLALLLSGLAAAMSTYQRRYGVWVSGFRAGATRTIAILLGIVLLGIMATVMTATRVYDAPWSGPVGALVAVAAGLVLGRAWMRAFRRDHGAAR